MPFTLAHPVVIMPFMKRSLKLSETALIAGSVMPDFEFFLQMREVENLGHHWAGVLIFDLPATLLFCFLFHGFLKKPLLRHVPEGVQRRLGYAYDFDWSRSFLKKPVMMIISATIGILSHLILDGFTHHDGFWLQWIPSLHNEVSISGKDIPVFYLLQLGFSFFGSMMAVMFVFTSKQGNHDVPKATFGSFWSAYLTVWFIIYSVRVIYFPIYNTFWGLVMAFLGTTVYALMIVSLIDVLKSRLQSTELENVKR
ncbi:DUF4184 family protein [Jiulongibacter sediminis]|uniref:DUF4184 family protein n=1 Tax=Jiulongibacter sediminis TaxID=1605367 RepID=UPI0026F24B10|nr:DUF4184 family protein [Jiulongibacter sediminis]